ncbi:hypothetical protein GCM10025867_15320 [Frondihabitans sucicola]|uniref:RDD domain-containing protein n=1 Tax=Frondihabitans sucicola TaxID=1268041 RepID=A0ABM8GLK9_9MICO|nr:RDD family protein [Frondihabitans sucicola]BDZ49291.1 hypothetical protein GCM10025867_15320 [Frondihabitans sucicola]
MTDSVTTDSTGAPVKPRFCSACGTPASSGAFCASCGTALTAVAPHAAASAPAPTVPPAPTALPAPTVPPAPTAAPAQHFPAPTQPAPTPLPVGTAPAAGPVPDAGSVPWQSQQPATPGYVAAEAVASQTTEYVQVAGLGAIRLASLGQRVGARLIDIVIVVLAYVIIARIVSAAAAASARATYSGYGYLESSAASIGAGIGGFILGTFLAAVFAYVYEVVMTAAWGRTVGKMIVGLRVIRAVDGRKPNVGNAFLRWISPGLGGLIPFVGPFGALLVLLSPTFDSSGRRQGWHDKMAGTLVVIGPKAVTKERGAALLNQARETADRYRR